MPKYNVDIRLADLPIAHRFAAWAITRRLRFTYREILSALADRHVIEICPCGDFMCTTMSFTTPDPGHLALPDGGNIWSTTSGMIGLATYKDHVEIEALRTDAYKPPFPHQEEIRQALHDGYSPTRTMHARQARQIFRKWLADLEESEIPVFEMNV